MKRTLILLAALLFLLHAAIAQTPKVRPAVSVLYDTQDDVQMAYQAGRVNEQTANTILDFLEEVNRLDKEIKSAEENVDGLLRSANCTDERRAEASFRDRLAAQRKRADVARSKVKEAVSKFRSDLLPRLAESDRRQMEARLKELSAALAAKD